MSVQITLFLEKSVALRNFRELDVQKADVSVQNVREVDVVKKCRVWRRTSEFILAAAYRFASNLELFEN